jgi:hypothetical protein
MKALGRVDFILDVTVVAVGTTYYALLFVMMGRIRKLSVRELGYRPALSELAPLPQGKIAELYERSSPGGKALRLLGLLWKGFIVSFICSVLVRIVLEIFS